MKVYAKKWFPWRDADAECMAEATFLEWDYWEKQKIVTANAIGIAFKKP